MRVLIVGPVESTGFIMTAGRALHALTNGSRVATTEGFCLTVREWEVRGPNPLSRPITSNIKGQGRTNATAKSNKSLHTDLKHFRR